MTLNYADKDDNQQSDLQNKVDLFGLCCVRLSRRRRRRRRPSPFWLKSYAPQRSRRENGAASEDPRAACVASPATSGSSREAAPWLVAKRCKLGWLLPLGSAGPPSSRPLPRRGRLSSSSARVPVRKHSEVRVRCALCAACA